MVKDNMASSREISVLALTSRAGRVSKWLVAKQLGISTEWAAYMLDSLNRRRLLEQKSGGYCLTSQGAIELKNKLEETRDKLSARKRLISDIENKLNKRAAELSSK